MKYLYVLLILLYGSIYSQNKNDSVKTPEYSTIEPFPIFSYDTDAGFGYGAKLFLLNTLNINESFDILLFNSTEGEKWYRLIFSVPDFEFRQGTVYPCALDLMVDYDKWIKTYFYGLGNYSSYENSEPYTKEPLEISLALSRGFTENLISQAGIRFKTIHTGNFPPNSLIRELIPPARETANCFSVFFKTMYDKRNSYINPSSGIALEAESEFAFPSSLTNTTFSRYAAWIKYYYDLCAGNNILALRLGAQSLTGNDIPIQILLPLGGNNTLRGYNQDRFLDKISILLNAELRFHIYKRFGGIAGLDAGRVSSCRKNLNFSGWSMNPVFGLRFYMDTFIVRLDIGLGKETTGLFFNFGHIY